MRVTNLSRILIFNSQNREGEVSQFPAARAMSQGCNFEVPVCRCTDIAYLYRRTWSIAQKGHNGACSQIGVHNEATGGVG